MKFPRRKFLHLAAGAAVLTVIVTLATHGAWPQATRTIKIVVPFAPGGAGDLTARLLADQIGRTHPLTLVIENRPGAGTVIATEAVARAAPDGTTVLIVGNSFLINPNVRKRNYDPLTSFEPVCLLTRSPNMIVVSSASPFRTLADLLNAARAKPGDVTIASNGPLTSQHMAVEMLKRAASVDLTYLPYPGGSPVTNALLGGHVTAAVTTYTTVAQQLRTGTLRALATTSRSRIEPMLDLPTVAESGYKDYEEEAWIGLVAPAKTPGSIISQFASWLTAAMKVPAVREKLVVQELYPVGDCGTDFGSYLRKQFDEYGRVLREVNIKAE